MSFPRYPKYKQSAVEWLGEVPVSWCVAPFKRQIARNDGGVWGDDPDGISDTIVLRSTDQTVDGRWQLDNPASRKLSGSDIDGALLDEGDLLLTKSSGSSLHIGKTTLVTAEIAEMRCCYSNFMQRIRTKPTFLPKLAWYVLNNQLARQQLDLVSNSTTGLANLNATMVGQLVVIVPPLAEQTAIAEFLDRETGKIDELVAEQRRLMELLKEKRQAVISHAVTKGLNPHAPMKPSGIEWLGDVPVGWKVTRLCWICSEINDINHEMPIAVESGVPFLSAKDLLDDGTLNFTKDIKMISEEDFAKLSRKICPRRGDIIYSRIGACLGKARLVETDLRFLISYSCCIVRVSDTIACRRFIRHLLDGEMILTEARIRTQGIGVPDLGLHEIGRFPVPLPPMQEQEAITVFLETELVKFDTLTAEAQRAIDLLQERRTALISAAVTGQIDVRKPPKN